MRDPRARRPVLAARLIEPRLRFEAQPQEAGRRLDEVLVERISSRRGRRVSKSEARKLIMVGAVRLGGRPVRQPAIAVAMGTWVEVLLKPDRVAAALPAFVLTEREVLYEDAVLIAVDKPAGLATHATVDPRRASLVSSLKAYLGGAGYVGVHQRLDRDTSGVVLFAKHPSANASLAEQFEGRRVVKVYLAWCAPTARRVPEAWRAADRLGPVFGSKPPRIGISAGAGTEAVTEFVVRRRLPHAWLVEARPRTGRKHQIRVQLAAAGMPILGDVLYGGPTHAGERAVARALLHAARLELEHPITREPLHIESPLPPDFRSFTSVERPAASGGHRRGRGGARVRPRRG